jgi:hypothetical protein
MATKPADRSESSQPEDPQKAKFREALARKNSGTSRPTGTKHGSEGHGPSTHGPEGGKREFRRKSGG